MSMSKGGSVPRLRWSSVRLAARDRTDAAIAKPETPFVRADELGDQISGNAWRAFPPGQKAGFEREIGFGGFEHLAVPSSPSRQRRGLSGRSHLSAKQMPKKRTKADSLMREKISLIARFNSLQGLKKLPVRLRRELARKALS
jgi:hypothetical protein